MTAPRIPCNTFRAWMDQTGWLKTSTADGRSGAYLRVITGGTIRSGDPVEIVARPDHDVTVPIAFRAMTGERELLPKLLDAGDHLVDELRELTLVV